jgi:hypothetical protein
MKCGPSKGAHANRYEAGCGYFGGNSDFISPAFGLVGGQ